MSVYADTGFIVSLYKTETTSALAARIMKRLQAPVWLSQLGELELRNAFQLAVFRGELGADAAARKMRLLLGDMQTGIFLSFDERQRKVAKAEGLKVLPHESVRR